MVVCELFSFAVDCDIPNWLTMTIELAIGGGIATIFFIRQHKQGRKLHELVIEQEKFRKRRASWFSHSLHSYLFSLRNQMNKVLEMKNDQKMHHPDSKDYIMLGDIIDEEKNQVQYFINKTEEILSESLDVLDPALINQTREILQRSKEGKLIGFGPSSYDYQRVNYKKIIQEIDELLKKIKLPSL